MKNSIKREQSQACLNFAERKNFRLKAKHKILMTLALLLTAVGGAWAEEKSETISTTTSQAEYTGEHFKITPDRQNDMLTVADLRNHHDGQIFFFIETLDGQNISKLDLQIGMIEDTSIDNLSLSSGTKSYDSNTKVLTITNVNADFVQITLAEGDKYGVVTISSVTYYYEESPAEAPITVEPGSSANTWTFTMPAYDVEIAPIYAPTAVFATDGNLVLTPTAIGGVYAESTDAIVTPGKVANIGETENAQGIVMYAVTSTNQATAPALDAFSADVPTAKDIKVGSEVLVWYYIKGADTPEGQEATAENTFNDSEICATPITVSVLSNQFDIQFNAANDNTIEAGKATVKVGDEAAEVKEGKLTGVKMNSKVSVTAKDGYKFRKVEVKKGGLLSIEIGGATTATIYYVEGETWAQALQNHPEENAAWKISISGSIYFKGYAPSAGGNFVNSSDTIDPNAGYTFQVS